MAFDIMGYFFKLWQKLETDKGGSCCCGDYVEEAVASCCDGFLEFSELACLLTGYVGGKS